MRRANDKSRTSCLSIVTGTGQGVLVRSRWRPTTDKSASFNQQKRSRFSANVWSGNPLNPAACTSHEKQVPLEPLQ